MRMALFDRNEDEQGSGEVRISMPDDEDESSGKLREEAEEKLSEKTGSSSGSSSSNSSSMLPGISSSGSESSSGSSSKSVSREDIHEQNKQIIELLNDIKKEVSQGGSNELL
jgi:hypothetical protein